MPTVPADSYRLVNIDEPAEQRWNPSANPMVIRAISAGLLNSLSSSSLGDLTRGQELMRQYGLIRR